MKLSELGLQNSYIYGGKWAFSICLSIALCLASYWTGFILTKYGKFWTTHRKYLSTIQTANGEIYTIPSSVSNKNPKDLKLRNNVVRPEKTLNY